MNRSTIHRHTGMWRGAAVIAAAITGALAAPSAATAVGAQGPAPDHIAPTWHEQVAARQELRRTVALMPAGWPATEAMRAHLEAPLGDVVQRARWQRAVELMPGEWPATIVMRAELAS